LPAWSGLVFALMSGLFLCVIGLLIYVWRRHEIVDLI